MAKSTGDTSELQNLNVSSLSQKAEEVIKPIKENVKNSSTSLPPNKNIATNPLIDKKNLQKTNSLVSTTSVTPSLKVSAPHPNDPPPSKVSYTNERKFDFSKTNHERAPPTPTPSVGAKRDNESTSSPKRPPRKTPLNNFSGDLFQNRLYGSRGILASRARVHDIPKRPVQHHSFETDAADVRQIEQGLLQLMEDFQTGNLRAFGKDSRLRQMEAIREQQEKLARLHFEVGAEQDLYPPLSEEGERISSKNKKLLMEKLTQLSESIERLHTNASTDRKLSTSERKNQGNTPAANQNHHSRPNPSVTNLHSNQPSHLNVPNGQNTQTPLSSHSKGK